MQFVLGYVTCKDEAEAAKIATALVKERMAACCNIVPKIRSIYKYKGKVEDTTESLLFIKTGKDKMNQVEKRVKQLHSYEVPSIIFYKSLKASDDYKTWAEGEGAVSSE